jgi:hypothetical protein
VQDVNSNEFVVRRLSRFWVLGRSFGDLHIIAICTEESRNSMHFADPPLLFSQRSITVRKASPSQGSGAISGTSHMPLRFSSSAALPFKGLEVSTA